MNQYIDWLLETMGWAVVGLAVLVASGNLSALDAADGGVRNLMFIGGLFCLIGLWPTRPPPP